MTDEGTLDLRRPVHHEPSRSEGSRGSAHRGVEEIDILLRNESTDPFWAQEGPYFLFECKNWSKPVGRSEIDVFVRKLERRHQRCRLGFFAAFGGFTDPADKVRLADTKDAVLVVLMDGEDLARLVAPGDRSEVLKELHRRAVMNSNGSY